MNAIDDKLNLLSDLIRKATAAGADGADAVFMGGRSLSLTRRLGRPEWLDRSESADVGLRVFMGKRQAIASSSDLSTDALEELVGRVLTMARSVPEDPYCGLAGPDLLATDRPDLDICDPAEPAAETLVERAARAEDGVFDVIAGEDAVAEIAAMIGAGRTAGIGSPRASLETNTALQLLVGSESFCNGLSSTEAKLSDLALGIYRARAARIPSLAEVEAADAVLVLGEDVLNTAPRIALALRQSVRNIAMEMATQAGIPQWQDAGVRGHAQDANGEGGVSILLSRHARGLFRMSSMCVDGTGRRA